MHINVYILVTYILLRFIEASSHTCEHGLVIRIIFQVTDVAREPGVRVLGRGRFLLCLTLLLGGAVHVAAACLTRRLIGLRRRAVLFIADCVIRETLSVFLGILKVFSSVLSPYLLPLGAGER